MTTHLNKPTDICISEISCETELFDYRSPMKFGGRVVRDVVLLNVSVSVKNRNGKTAIGFGSMTLGNIWAWPGGKTDPNLTLQVMLELGHEFVHEAAKLPEYGHPLEITYDFSQTYQSISESFAKRRFPSLTEPIPALAQRVAASPVEAAIFDAYGKLYGQNVYNLLSSEWTNRDLGDYLGEEFRGEQLDQYTLRKPKDRMPLYHLVGALDPLTKAEVRRPLHDGLPEFFADWIPYNGLTHFKIKLNGNDLAWDVKRVLDVDRICVEQQQMRNCETWFYSADFNERCENIEYVLEFLRKIEESSPTAIQRLQYIEQPTNRNWGMGDGGWGMGNCQSPKSHTPHPTPHIPIVADESLIDFESLQLSRQMGYTGVALKACKGQSEALLMGAAAQKYQMFLCVQDLTCPGASFLHSASLAARIPTVAAIEGNGRQYCPAANEIWKDRFPSMFHITDGTLGTYALDGPGLY